MLEKNIEDGKTLKEFLNELALKPKYDDLNDVVKLMTIHQAKGLEARVVFIVEARNELMPGNKKGLEIEEERRVFYVGVTRAKERLYFSIAQMRRMYGKDNPGFPSEFLKSISKDKLNEVGFGIKERVTTPSYSPIKKVEDKKESKTSTGFKVGDKIMHKVFGKGIIVKVEFTKITVAFSKEFGIRIIRFTIEKLQ